MRHDFLLPLPRPCLDFATQGVRHDTSSLRADNDRADLATCPRYLPAKFLVNGNEKLLPRLLLSDADDIVADLAELHLDDIADPLGCVIEKMHAKSDAIVTSRKSIAHQALRPRLMLTGFEWLGLVSRPNI
ncbi:hypothetical protein SAMN02927924_00075 [Sphingobium faniae]|nr:hypothetical protein SAMN02927924_00075 [Sphingobium faniae]